MYGSLHVVRRTPKYFFVVICFPGWHRSPSGRFIATEAKYVCRAASSSSMSEQKLKRTTTSLSRTVCFKFQPALFWTEKLIKHMIQDSPEAVGLTNGELGVEAHTLADKVKLIFMKNGIPPNAHPQLLDDLVKLLESEARK